MVLLVYCVANSLLSCASDPLVYYEPEQREGGRLRLSGPLYLPSNSVLPNPDSGFAAHLCLLTLLLEDSSVSLSSSLAVLEFTLTCSHLLPLIFNNSLHPVDPSFPLSFGSPSKVVAFSFPALCPSEILLSVRSVFFHMSFLPC